MILWLYGETLCLKAKCLNLHPHWGGQQRPGTFLSLRSCSQSAPWTWNTFQQWLIHRTLEIWNWCTSCVPAVFLQEIPHCASFPHHHFKGILKSVSHRNCLQQKRNVKITPEAKAQPSEKLNGQYLDFLLEKGWHCDFAKYSTPFNLVKNHNFGSRLF